MRWVASRFAPARGIVLITLLLPLVYALSVGLERFWWESWGTWLLSPIIYVKVLPAPVGEILLRSMNAVPEFCNVLCAIPVGMLLLSSVLALRAFLVGSIVYAGAAFWLVSAVFIVYHHLQPLGMQFIAAH
jgi:hypothetical protein